MGQLNEQLGYLTVAAGATVSNSLSDILSSGQLRTALHFMDAMTIRAPQNLTETANIQVARKRNPSASDWITTTSIELLPGADILDEWGVVITDESASLLPLLTEGMGSGASAVSIGESFWDLRIVLSDPADAQRLFYCSISLLVSGGA